MPIVAAAIPAACANRPIDIGQLPLETGKALGRPSSRPSMEHLTNCELANQVVSVFALAKRASTSFQFTMFQKAVTYSARRFWYFR